ncbi:unnamed protein product [Meloidogyne enterolobii]|uniref:Uncharacterized protein n=1 Tax=Meloidogyne enterolobii TaxID=390850 RepID=A0ACB0ZAE2_MELEN
MRILITILNIQFTIGFALLIPPKEETGSKIGGLANEKTEEKPEVTKEEKRESEEKDEIIPEEKPDGKEEDSDTKNEENPQGKAKRGEDTIASIREKGERVMMRKARLIFTAVPASKNGNNKEDKKEDKNEGKKEEEKKEENEEKISQAKKDLTENEEKIKVKPEEKKGTKEEKKIETDKIKAP